MQFVPTSRRRRLLALLIGLITIGAIATYIVVFHPQRTNHTGSANSNNLNTSNPSSSGAPTTSSNHKPYITGLMNRQGPPDASLVSRNGNPLISAFVIQINWKDVQPRGPSDFDTTAIDSQLSFAKQHNMPVRFRIYAGANAPDWVKSQVGSVTWYGTPSDGGPDSYNVPKFWTSGYMPLWQAFNQKMASKYDADPTVREVVPGACITYFAEPFIRQFSNSQNITTASGAGYTDALDDACLKATIDGFKTAWATTNMDMTLNPFQSISGSKADSLTEPTAIASYCIQQLGVHCVLGNNSLKAGSRGADYDALYKMMTSKNAPIYIQTATNAKIGDWQTALSDAASIGALSVELPVGYNGYDLTTLQTYNGKLAANTARAQQ